MKSVGSAKIVHSAEIFVLLIVRAFTLHESRM